MITVKGRNLFYIDSQSRNKLS